MTRFFALALGTAVISAASCSQPPLTPEEADEIQRSFPASGRIPKLEKYADRGDAEAQFRVGEFKQRGGEYAEALQLYQKAAAQGHDRGQFALGWMYANGWGVPKSDAEAVKWFSQGADQGDPVLQAVLGDRYLSGQYIPQSDKEAARWLFRAAFQGNGRGQYVLGVMYRDGRFVGSLIDAHMWLNLAAASGEPGAADARDSLAEQMSPDDVKDAQQQALDWKPVPER